MSLEVQKAVKEGRNTNSDVKRNSPQGHLWAAWFLPQPEWCLGAGQVLMEGRPSCGMRTLEHGLQPREDPGTGAQYGRVGSSLASLWLRTV